MRWIEFFVLAAGVPIIVRFDIVPVHPFLLLWGASIMMALVLLRDPTYRSCELWGFRGLRSEMTRIALRSVAAAALLGLAIAAFTPELFFGFARHAPARWALVSLLYPVLSVYPQAIVYRAFFLHRYRVLVHGRLLLVLLSACAFGFMHIVFANPVAPALSFLAGIALADTHSRSRSLLASSVEHAIYGWLIFTLGWGGWFNLGR